MKRTKSVLVRTQSSGKSLLVTLVNFNKPLVEEFKTFLRDYEIKKFFTGNFAQLISQRTLSVGYEVNCQSFETAQIISQQVKDFCERQKLKHEQQKMSIPQHRDADEAHVSN